MKTRSLPWVDAAFVPMRECQRLGWFMYRQFEREHQLNLDALLQHWQLAPLSWLNPLPPPAAYPGPAHRQRE